MIMFVLPLVSALAIVEPVAGPCDLIDKATLTALLGQPAPAGNPTGPEKDEDTGGMVSHCMYRVGDRMAIVSEVMFANAAAARKAVSSDLIKSRLDGEDAKVTEEKGVGDAAFWGEGKRGGEYVVLKGNRVVAVSLGGQLPKPVASYHDALRAAASAGASR